MGQRVSGKKGFKEKGETSDKKKWGQYKGTIVRDKKSIEPKGLRDSMIIVQWDRIIYKQEKTCTTGKLDWHIWKGKTSVHK